MMRECYCANAKGFPGVDRPVIHVSAKNCIQFSQSDKADKNMELPYRENRVGVKSKERESNTAQKMPK